MSLNRLCFVTSPNVAATSGVSIQPRKTSIWSSSLGSNTRHIAIGCDKKVLYFTDRLNDEGRNLGTGSAVFALQHSANDNTLVIGTRSGQIRLYDLREPRTNAEDIIYRPDVRRGQLDDRSR